MENGVIISQTLIRNKATRNNLVPVSLAACPACYGHIYDGMARHPRTEL